MREFFRGWKRKAGSLTLVMACLLLGAWFRSLNYTDRYGDFSAEYEYHCLASSKANLVWLRIVPSDVSQVSEELKNSFNGDDEQLKQIVDAREKEVRAVFKQLSVARIDSILKALWTNDDKFEWNFRGCGLAVGIGSKRGIDSFGAVHVTVWKLSYWSLLMPLTTLSALLLLRKTK